MKRLLLLFCSLFLGCVVIFAQCPPEWTKYTTSDYLYEIHSEQNVKKLSETEFKQALQNAAHLSLAKKVKVQVSDNARMSKEVVDGKSSSSYVASTQFSTDVNLVLTDSKYKYNAKTKEGTIIVYINKTAARLYYKNAINDILNRTTNAIAMAQSYIDKGFKDRARTELETALPELSKTDEPIFWLNFFEVSFDELNEYSDNCNNKRQTIKNMLADLEHSTKIFVACAADMFGTPYTALEGETKSKLTKITGGCSFVDSESNADWVIKINANAEERNTATFYNVTTYYSYVSAQLSIFKTATSQIIYEDEIAIKGGHSLSYKEAAKAAYKEVSKKISEIITNSIQQ